MLREVAAFFADPPEPLQAFETTDAEHGRVETRRHRVTHSVDWPNAIALAAAGQALAARAADCTIPLWSDSLRKPMPIVAHMCPSQ